MDLVKDWAIVSIASLGERSDVAIPGRQSEYASRLSCRGLPPLASGSQ
jgi:hypothetical protein